MRFEREKGPTGRKAAVETAHRERTGKAERYFEIAASLYDERVSCEGVQQLMDERYGVSVHVKTISAWINRGLLERRLALSGGEAIAAGSAK